MNRVAPLLLALTLPAAVCAQDSRPTQTEPVTRSLGAVTITIPPEWEEQEPQNTMRKAQLRLPRADGDDRDAELVVFHFRGGGGGVEANIDRWLGQFQQPDGSATRDAAEIAEREVAGLEVHTVDVTGTYVAQVRPGAGERVNNPNTRLLAAIVISSDGPYFFKLVGPAATVEHWKEHWEAFVAAIRAVE